MLGWWLILTKRFDAAIFCDLIADILLAWINFKALTSLKDKASIGFRLNLDQLGLLTPLASIAYQIHKVHRFHLRENQLAYFEREKHRQPGAKRSHRGSELIRGSDLIRQSRKRDANERRSKIVRFLSDARNDPSSRRIRSLLKQRSSILVAAVTTTSKTRRLILSIFGALTCTSIALACVLFVRIHNQEQECRRRYSKCVWDRIVPRVYFEYGPYPPDVSSCLAFLVTGTVDASSCELAAVPADFRFFGRADTIDLRGNELDGAASGEKGLGGAGALAVRQH